MEGEEGGVPNPLAAADATTQSDIWSCNSNWKQKGEQRITTILQISLSNKQKERGTRDNDNDKKKHIDNKVVVAVIVVVVIAGGRRTR